MTERHGERPDTPIDEPAPTVTSKWRSDEWSVDRRTVSRGAGGGRVPTALVAVSEPAPTLTGKSPGQWIIRRNDQTNTSEIDRDWPLTRPATTLASRDLVPDPGANANRFNGLEKSRNDGIKITLDEALTLQSFDPNYPLQGSRSKQFEQVGNAVPPRLAMHVLAALLGLDTQEVAA